jgi:hypothetical protein
MRPTVRPAIDRRALRDGLRAVGVTLGTLGSFVLLVPTFDWWETPSGFPLAFVFIAALVVVQAARMGAIDDRRRRAAVAGTLVGLLGAIAGLNPATGCPDVPGAACTTFFDVNALLPVGVALAVPSAYVDLRASPDGREAADPDATG